MLSRRRRRLRPSATQRPLLMAVLLSAMCCSLGNDRNLAREADDREKLPPAGGASAAVPRQVKEEVLNNRRGPAWLAKLPQKLQKGDSGNRPFAVQDARVAGGLRAAVPQSSTSKARPRQAFARASERARARGTERELGSPDSNDHNQVMVPPAPPMGNAVSPVRARTPEAPRGWDGRVLAYDQEQLWRTRAREAWNSMLENARVGLLSKGKLIVEPRLAGAASSIMAAALTGDVHELKAALDQDGAHIGVTNGVGETPLMLAAISGNSECMAILLARGAEVDTRDAHGWTALMKAVALGDDKAVGFLLTAGADPEVRNAANQTACSIAGAWGRLPAERLLVSAGACPSPLPSPPASDGTSSSGASGATPTPLPHSSRPRRAAVRRPALKTRDPGHGGNPGHGARGAPAEEDAVQEKALLMKDSHAGDAKHSHAGEAKHLTAPSPDPARSHPAHAHHGTPEEGAREWKREADVRLQWLQAQEKEAERWIEELAVNHERHLTQYRISSCLPLLVTVPHPFVPAPPVPHQLVPAPLHPISLPLLLSLDAPEGRSGKAAPSPTLSPTDPVPRAY